VVITVADLHAILGPKRFEPEIAMRTSVPGVATGNHWRGEGWVYQLMILGASPLSRRSAQSRYRHDPSPQTRDDMDLIVAGSLGSVDRCQDRARLTWVAALVTPAARLASRCRLGFDASPGY
jgi:hypothetical protein